MKLRIEPKTIRIRLSEKEFSLLQTENRLSEKVEFDADNYLVYTLIAGNYSNINAQFMPLKLEIHIPFSVLRNWVSSGSIGISSNHGEDNTFDKPVIIIEKDLPPRNRKKG